MCYSADDLLPVCEELGIPLVVSVSSNRVPLSSLKRKKVRLSPQLDKRRANIPNSIYS